MRTLVEHNCLPNSNILYDSWLRYAVAFTT